MHRSIWIAALALPCAAAADLSPTRLRTEYLDNPIGIDVKVPRLSWIDESQQRGARQSAYRILVASRPQLLAVGKADLWDSGQVRSRETTQIEYQGSPLKSGQRAYWSVTVWDTDGNATTSKPAFWEAGLSPNDWQAKWIGIPELSSPPAAMSQARWIWFPEGSPAQDAPSGKRMFRYTFNLPAGNRQYAHLGVAVDDSFSLKVNGKAVGNGGGWTAFDIFKLTDLNAGANTIEITATNDSSRAGLLVVGEVKTADGSVTEFLTGKDWESSTDGKTWVPAMDLAPMNGRPYGVTQWSSVPKEAPMLRRQIDVKKRLLSARAYVSAKGLYNLYVDGNKVGRDVFTPGWTDYNKRIQYQTYDLTKSLQHGSHTLGMVLGDGWYCGHVGLTGRGSNYGEKPLGIAKIELRYADGQTETIATGDDGWQAATGPILSDDLLMGEEYDARLASGFLAGKANVKTISPEVRPLGSVPLVAQSAPPVRKLTELTPKKITEPKPGVYVYDLAQNMVGWARLRAHGPAGTKIQLRFAEMLNPDGTVYTTNLRGAKATDTYTLSGNGVETYEPSFTFHGFRYVEVTGYPGRPGKGAITGVVLGSDNAQTGTFSTSNALVNQLWHNIYWGQRGNYLEVPTDCPQRDERLGWMGDAQIFAPTACYNNDVAAFLTKWTQDVVDAQSPAGGFSDVTPRIGDLSDGAPAWGDAGVIVPWTVYEAYGDLRLLRQRYPAMKKWVDYIDSVNPNHIWVNRSNNNFGDWLNVQDDTPRDVIGTAYFARSTDLVARTARLLGESVDADHYGALLSNIKRAFNEHFVDADVKIKADTQTDYVLALNFDLLPAGKREAAAKRLVDHILIDRKGHLSTGFVGVGGLNPTLTAIGRTDVAYKLLLTDTYPSWGYSIRQGATTIWERWDGWTDTKGFQDPGMNSFNHYSLGSVGEWMYRTVAGIGTDPNAPGYDKIVIHPIPGGDLTHAEATFDSIRGQIKSAWRLNRKSFELNVTIPANTTARIYVPASNAAEVLEGDGAARNSVGVRYSRMEGGYAVFEVGGGVYRFVSQKQM